jgi:hypothetical protein
MITRDGVKKLIRIKLIRTKRIVEKLISIVVSKKNIKIKDEL